MTMYTALIIRPERVVRDWYGDVTDVIGERTDIVYSSNLDEFEKYLKDTLMPYIKESINSDVYSPGVYIFFDGVPEADSEIFLPFNWYEWYNSTLKEEKKQIAIAANNARLEEERKEKQSREFAERQQYEALRKKFGD